MPLILLAWLPVASYRTALTRATTDNHPLRTSRDCIQSVRDQELAAGRPAPGMYVYLPSGYYLHNYFYYYRHLGWDVRSELSDQGLMRMLDAPGEQRPVLMPGDRFAIVRSAHDVPGTTRALVPVANVVVLLPGPYAKCGL